MPIFSHKDYQQNLKKRGRKYLATGRAERRGAASGEELGGAGVGRATAAVEGGGGARGRRRREEEELGGAPEGGGERRRSLGAAAAGRADGGGGGEIGRAHV